VRRNVKGESIPILIIVFIHEAVKDRVMRQKIIADKGKKVTIYFNNVLSSLNRQIYAEARKLVREKKIFRTWTVGGDVFIAREEGDYKQKITSVDHLHYVANYEHENDVQSEDDDESFMEVEGLADAE
jgi:hypothetical protein